MALCLYNNANLEDLKRYIPDCSGVFVIIDRNFLKVCPCPLPMEWHYIPIRATERAKYFTTVERICMTLMFEGADRNSFVIGIGGGITTDITGFVSAIYKRGVRFALVPTTLLAQADAAIGGKNGVNLRGFKNMLGAIRQPEFVLQSIEPLRLLPPRYFTEGIAEILKTFAIFDAPLFYESWNFFKNFDITKASKSEEDKLQKIISACIRYKAAVAERDPFETGERRLLNFGHTFGHAIERECIKTRGAKQIMHGEAVACGMVIAAKIAKELGRCSASTVEELTKALRECGLPTDCGVEMATLIWSIKESIRIDKKVCGKSIHFIVPHAIGKVRDEVIKIKQLTELAYEIV